MRRRYIFLVACLVIGLIPAACASPGRLETEEKIEGQSIADNWSAGTTGMKLYFRNMNYDPSDPESAPVIPVPRPATRDEFTARAILMALMSGPVPKEKSLYAAGPVINGTDLELKDIYIKNEICVIHLSSPHPLPLYDVEGQTAAQAEEVFTQSLIRSMAALPKVEATWLFLNGRPWRGSAIDWRSPLAPPERGIAYTLYFRKESADEYKTGQAAELLYPVQIKLFPSQEGAAAGCSFFQIIELLSQNYGSKFITPLPHDIRALDFILKDGMLTINLTGSYPSSPQNARVFIESLVYTFTELPEVDSVMVTMDGNTWYSCEIYWNYHLNRDGLR